MAGKWNGEEGAKDCSRRIEKVTRLPGADKHLRLLFARVGATPFRRPSFVTFAGEYSYPFRRRDTGLKNRDTFQAATSNVIPSSPRELIPRYGRIEVIFFFRPHAFLHVGHFSMFATDSRTYVQELILPKYSHRQIRWAKDLERYTREINRTNETQKS